MSLIERDHTISDWLAAHPGKARPCRDCGEPIFFARSRRGAMVPFDVIPAPSRHIVHLEGGQPHVRNVSIRESTVHRRHAGVTHTVHQCERTSA